MNPPPIVVRPWVLEDLEAAWEMYSDSDVMRYLGTGAVMPDLETMEAKLADLIRRQDELGDLGYYAVCTPDSSRPIGAGICKAIPFSDGIEGPHDLEIGWHLAKAWWGKGYGTAIALAMLERAKTKGKPIVAVAYPENSASTHIMDKIGLTPRGLTDKYYNIPGLALYVFE